MSYIVNTGTASPARIKNALSTRELESVTTVEGLQAVERLSFVSLPSGKLLLMLNSCSGADAHDSARPPLDKQVYFGCDINLQRVDPSDNWNRSQIQLLSSTDLPEVRGVGLWAEEKNGSIDRVILLLWSATCPTKEETCKCNKEDGCKIMFQEGLEPFCLSSFYEGTLAPNGARLCQGTGATVRERNGECYGYSLDGGHGWECNSVPTAPKKMSAGNIFASRSTAKDAAAWHATKENAWERHGIRLGSSTSMPYGSLLVAEFDGNGVLQWIRTVADDAVIPYKQEQRASIVGSEITGIAGLKQTQFAVTVMRERWERKEEKVIVTPNCETFLLNSSGEPEKEQLQKSECESCLYSVASIHPETHNWASLCVSGRGPMQGISINGRLAVDSMGRYQAETQQSDLPDDSLLYYNDTGARLLPVGGGKWVLVWREVSWIESDIDGLNAKSATLKAALWVDENGLGAPVPLLGPVLEQRLMNPDAVSLSLHTAVLTVANYLDEEALAATLDLSNAGVPELSATTAVAGVYWGALFGQTYGHPLLRLSDASALWLGSIKENNSPFVGPSILLPDWKPSDTSRAVVISVEQGEQDCQGRWEAGNSTCPSTCLQRHLFRSLSNSAGCPWEADAFRLVHCEGGACPDWREGATFSPNNAATSGTKLLDNDLVTKVDLGPGMESIEIRLAQPVNLEGVEIYIQRASVSLVLSIVDAEGNWLLSVSSSFSAAPLDSPAGAHAWVTRYLSLKRVNVLHLRASPVTPNSSAQAGNWSVGVLEIRLHSTPLLACAGGGFLGNQEDCEAPVMLPSSLEALDCQGEWEDWSICDVSCTRMRQFNVVSPPKRGGRPCPSHELEPCTGGGLCSVSESANELDHRILSRPMYPQSISTNVGVEAAESSSTSTNCTSVLSPKSNCNSCRTLQIHQVTRQATGKGQRCPEEQFVLEYCDANCAAAYGPTTTTTTTTTMGLIFTSSAVPLVNMENPEDIMLLLRTVAIYFLVVLLACLITAYMVGIFEGGQTQKEGNAPTEQVGHHSSLPSLATAAPASTFAEGAVNSSQRAAANTAARDKRKSSLSALRLSLLGGNLLPSDSDSESSSNESFFGEDNHNRSMHLYGQKERSAHVSPKGTSKKEEFPGV